MTRIALDSLLSGPGLRSEDTDGRVACPRCGEGETLGDLARRTDALRRRLSRPAPSAPQLSMGGVSTDVCVACGTIYYPWVRREASRRLLELGRLEAEAGLRTA